VRVTSKVGRCDTSMTRPMPLSGCCRTGRGYAGFLSFCYI